MEQPQVLTRAGGRKICRKDLRVLMDTEMNVSQRCALAAQKAHSLLGCFSRVLPAGGGRRSFPAAWVRLSVKS